MSPKSGSEFQTHLVKALRKLGITGDTLFKRICDELDRGNTYQARRQLDFVDVLVNTGVEADDHERNDADQ